MSIIDDFTIGEIKRDVKNLIDKQSEVVSEISEEVSEAMVEIPDTITILLGELISLNLAIENVLKTFIEELE